MERRWSMMVARGDAVVGIGSIVMAAGAGGRQHWALYTHDSEAVAVSCAIEAAEVIEVVKSPA